MVHHAALQPIAKRRRPSLDVSTRAVETDDLDCGWRAMSGPARFDQRKK
jgi:hypothetical protein